MEQKNEEQYFRLVGYTWDVGAILDFIEDNQDDVEMQTLDPNMFNNIIGFIDIDEKHADTKDINLPGIIVEYKRNVHMLIDGWHRTWKAKKEGQQMRYYILSYEQQKPFMVG
ncbi:hypothetical protein D3C71_1518590 [compost metagenome]